MGKKDSRVDDYIAKAPAFARPILTEIRERVHAACPDVEETMKWRQPSFEYKGMLCGMAAFKAHCVFGYWKAPLVLGTEARGTNAMGYRDKLTSVADLPGKATFRAQVKKAMALNDAGITIDKRARTAKAPVAVPDDLAAALRKNRKARVTFDGFSPSHRREYVEWIAEAKTEATRSRRIQQTLEWVAEGKPRNWKYM